MTFSFIESEDQLRYEQRGSNAVLLNQQRAQVRVAAFGDAAQIGFAAAGILSGRQAQPGTKLRAVAELFEIAPL